MRILPVVLVCLTTASCGAGEPDADPANEAGAVAPGAAVVANSDPCALILVSEWEAATGYNDIEADRSAPDTCDFLSDTLWGVIGTVSLQNREFLEYMARRSETSPLTWTRRWRGGARPPSPVGCRSRCARFTDGAALKAQPGADLQVIGR